MKSSTVAALAFVAAALRNGVGARLVHTRDYDFDVGFAASLPLSSSDIAVRRGMPDLGRWSSSANAAPAGVWLCPL